jgi:GTP-binding protein
LKITSAEFITSSTDPARCPDTGLPEFAFIGRSNVGKSSLINMLAAQKDLAKTSGQPGKTQTINHFLINNSWYLVDLPGYGFARVSRTQRAAWSRMIENYLAKRMSLFCTFILIDSRIDPQPADLTFIDWMGTHGLPLAIVFTKTDKLKVTQWQRRRAQWVTRLLEYWEELPPLFDTSAEKKKGRAELLDFIAAALARADNL